MPPSFSRMRFWPGVLIPTMSGAVLSGLALMVLALAQTGSPWTAINATSHILHGPEAAAVPGFDLRHTVVGLAIHTGSCLFWAAVAMGLLRLHGRRDRAWILLTGVATGLIALVLDYGILPRALSPGWHLVLGPAMVLSGFLALGLGLALGLMVVARQPGESVPRRTRPATPPPVHPRQGRDEVAALRRGPGIIDQRQQRIDPANHVTHDPNSLAAYSTKQPGRSPLTDPEGNDP